MSEEMIVNHLGHRWYVLDEPSRLGEKYIKLKRVSYMGEIRQGKAVAVFIDVPVSVFLKLGA